MNKRKKGWIIGLSITAVVVAGVAIGIFVLRDRASAALAQMNGNSNHTITRGNLEKTVTGTGSLSNGDSQFVSLPHAVTLAEIMAEAGQAVKAGEALARADTDALEDVIDELTGQITALDQNIAGQKRRESTTETLKSPAAGRVKALYAQAGQSVQEVMAEHGALALLSTDGKMRVDIPAGDLQQGQAVKVIVDGTGYDGVVSAVQGDTASVTFTDDGIATDAQAQVQKDGVTLGEGTAQINMPLEITAQEGTIDKVHLSENQSVTQSTSTFYLTNKPTSKAYAALVQERADTLDLLRRAQELKQAGGVITAPVDGVVGEVTAQENQPLAADERMLTLHTTDSFNLVVGVDELDIGNVQLGQDANIELDALEGQVLTGTVKKISQLGSPSGGVTTYSVTLEVPIHDGMKMGMNGTATILVEQRENVLLVPIQALQSSRGEQYVWLAGEGDDGAPGIRTPVETGLSDSNYAEVLSGLNEGDEVVVVRSATDTGMPMFGMGGMVTSVDGEAFIVETDEGRGAPPQGERGGQR